MNKKTEPIVWRWIVAGAVFAAAFLVYYVTLAPTITWSHDGVDSGDLVTAAITGGVPHPPGYPTYMLLASAFAAGLPLSEPAKRVNVLSALSAALASSLTSLTTFHLLDRLANTQKENRLAEGTFSISAGLLLAFSPTHWSQAVITEVYALHTAIVATIITIILLYWHTDSPHKARIAWWGAALLLGLGAGNHLSILLLTPALLLAIYWWIWPKERRVITWLGLVGSLCLGLTVYLTLPLRARGQPPINWGDPQTLERFVWLVSGQLYRQYLFALPLSALPARLASSAALLRQQFGLWGIGLGLVGVWYLFSEKRKIFYFTLLVYLSFLIYALGYNTTDSYVYLLPGYIVFALWIGYGMYSLWREWVRLQKDRRLAMVPLLLCLSLPIFSLASYWPAIDLSQDRLALEYAQKALHTVQPGALLLTDGDGPTFALWYAHHGLGIRPDVAVINIALWSYSWYRTTMGQLKPDIVFVRGEREPPASLADLIEANRANRAIYLTGEDSWLARAYLWHVEGNLLRLE